MKTLLGIMNTFGFYSDTLYKQISALHTKQLGINTWIKRLWTVCFKMDKEQNDPGPS